MKTGNQYAAAFGRLYDTTPKAVFAAIAFSYCSRGGDNQAEAVATFLNEWHILHANGIVPQAPPNQSATTPEPDTPESVAVKATAAREVFDLFRRTIR